MSSYTIPSVIESTPQRRAGLGHLQPPALRAHHLRRYPNRRRGRQRRHRPDAAPRRRRPAAEIQLYLNSPGGSFSAVMADLRHHAVRRAGRRHTLRRPGGVDLRDPARRRRPRQASRCSPTPESVLQQPHTEGSRGSISDLALEAAEIARIRTQAEALLARHTGRTADQIRADIDRALVLAGQRRHRLRHRRHRGRARLRPPACAGRCRAAARRVDGGPLARALRPARAPGRRARRRSRSEEISLRPRSTSDRYGSDTAASSATSASVRSCR